MGDDDDYTGLLDGYIILTGATKGSIDELIGSAGPGKQRRYAAATSGSWDAFLATTQQGLSEVEEISEGLRNNPSTTTYMGVYPRAPFSLKWSVSQPFEALLEVFVGAGYDPVAVADTLLQAAGCEGLSVVAAPFDIVMGVGGETFGELKDNILGVNTTEGVDRTITHFVLRSSERPDGPPPVED